MNYEIFRKYFKDTWKIFRTTKDTAEGFLGIPNYKELAGVGRSSLGKSYELGNIQEIL